MVWFICFIFIKGAGNNFGVLKLTFVFFLSLKDLIVFRNCTSCAGVSVRKDEDALEYGHELGVISA